MEIRNLAIIAHVDHGKTALTNALLQQSNLLEAGKTLDSNELEQERGITIYAKNTSVFYRQTKINLIDTPGHADFGSEVERVLKSIDSVLLVVDAQEGPLPQTKFVLQKALELDLKPIVVLNKIDKPVARPDWAHEAVFELFAKLGATDEQLDFPVVYTIGKTGLAKLKMAEEATDLKPLLDLILQKVPPASAEPLQKQALSAQVFNLGYDNFLGRLAVLRIYTGHLRIGEQVLVKKINGQTQTHKITKIFTFEGLQKKAVQAVAAGEIVMIAGIPDIFIGETLCQQETQAALPAIQVDEPTISLNFLVNNSPFKGQEGKFVTNRQLKTRLEKELEINVGLKVDFSATDHYKVFGRGELHIAILLENLRREGYELQVSQPQVITKEIGGVKCEPFEEVTVDVPAEFSGPVIEKLSKRKGHLSEMRPALANTRIIFEIPTRGLLGYKNEFTIDTKGEGVICTRIIGFKPWVEGLKKQTLGSLVSLTQGKALAFSLANLQERGSLYIGPNTAVYPGMVLGNVAKGHDLPVNPTKGKQLTNVRAAGTDLAIKLTPPLFLTLERGLELMKEDEYLEVTPQNIRLRKI